MFLLALLTPHQTGMRWFAIILALVAIGIGGNRLINGERIKPGFQLWAIMSLIAVAAFVWTQG